MEFRQVKVVMDVQAEAAEGEAAYAPLDRASVSLKEQAAWPELLAVWVGGQDGTLQPELAMAVDASDEELARIGEHLAEMLRQAPGVQAVQVTGIERGEPLYQKTCRIGGEIFYARKEQTQICRDHWYDESMKEAQGEYQPLIDAIKAATGLDSWVWQSGGMTMTLVTGSDDPYKGDRYLTLVEGFHEDGTLEGSSGFYSAESEDNDEGENVVQAYVGGNDKPSEGAGFARAILPVLWAEIIANHQRSRGGGQ